MERPQDVLDELRQLVAANEINNLSRQKLERYVAVLSLSQAESYFEASQFRQVCETLRTTLAIKKSEEADAENNKVKEEQAALRHEQIHAQLVELKKPHWSLTPVFIVAVLAMLFAAISAWPVIRELFQASLLSRTDSSYPHRNNYI